MVEDLVGGTILIVEDEVLIGEAIKEVLEAAGFRAIVAMDPEQATAILERDRARDLVGLVTDINLGGPINGWQIASRSRELNPGLAVVYMSGDSAAEWIAHGVPHSTVLQKPFALAQVVMAVGSLLNRTDLGG